MSYDEEFKAKYYAGGVEKAWALPDLSEVATMEPFSAFMMFSGYASGALASRYVDDLKQALLNEASGEVHAAMDMVDKNPPSLAKVDQTTFEIRLERGPAFHQLDGLQILRIERNIAQRLPQRIAPLLPAIRAYTNQRGTDPITAGRLSWLIDTIRQGHEYVTQPKSAGAPGTPLELIYAFMDLWRDLYTGLLDIAGQYGTSAAPAPANGTTATQDTTEQRAAPIQWKGSVQQLAWVLRELAEKGWIGYPAQKGDTTKWKAGDINASAFAKAMAPHFKEVKEKTLAQELKPEGGTVPAGDVEGWEIPKRPE